MKIFLDTANIEDIKRGAAMGVLDGITTNPSLLAKEGVEYKERVLEIAKIVDGPISAECISETTEELIAEAFRIAEWHENIVVKIPLTEAGLAATNQITSEGIKVNTTLIFSPNQALLAAKAGSTYVSPFIGRLNDAGHDGMEVIREIADIFNQSELETEGQDEGAMAHDDASGEDSQQDISVDDDGVEWWEDEEGVWWYRSPEMDDWEVWEE